MPLGLKNAPAIFSRIVVKAFQEYIYKSMGVYINDWTIYSMMKDHIKWLRLMLERCRWMQLSPNIKKCIFATPIGILLGHIVCKEGIKVDMAKIKVIVDLKAPINAKQIRIFLGHTGYYRKFIKQYSDITYLLEELLRADIPYIWTNECQQAFELLKRKLVEAPILKFPDWLRKFHVHIDASALVVGAILAQPADDYTNHPNIYASRKLNKAERNYSNTEREALGMAFALQKFRHYLLANPFIFYTDHQALKYLVNKPLHHGRICRWLLLFQEFEFEVIIRPGKANVGPDHLSRIESGEDPTGIQDDLPNAHLFRVEAIPSELTEIGQYLQEGKAPNHY
jgi:hypothetical protein